METQRGRRLRTGMWIAVDRPAGIGDRTVVVATEYIGVDRRHPGCNSGEMEYRRGVGGSQLGVFSVVTVRWTEDLENWSCYWDSNPADYSRDPGGNLTEAEMGS